MCDTALVADIKRNALDDGPGIRTTIFFKGCVLACVWCQNPECLAARPELQRQAGTCLECGACAVACPHGAVSVGPGGQRLHDRRACAQCCLSLRSGAPRASGASSGARCREPACVAGCPAGARRVVGRELELDELLGEALRDEAFQRNSGGGVTLSGGEATRQLRPVAALAAQLRARGVHVLLQTCGLYDSAAFEAELLPHLDAIYFDVKLADADAHQRHTGRDNHLILQNLERLARLVPGRLLPRVPLVPEITDGEANLRAIAALLRRLQLGRVALLPYNPLWLPKRLELGLELDYRHDRFMSAAGVERCRALVRAAGLEVI